MRKSPRLFKPSPRSSYGHSHGNTMSALNLPSNDFLGLGVGRTVRSRSLNTARLGGGGGSSYHEYTTGSSNVRVLYRYDGWPEAQQIHIFKFNQNQKGMNVRAIIQQIENKTNEKVEYEQLRYATNPTYLHGKRGWQKADEDSFIPFLIGEDGVNEVDIWFRTKEFIHHGRGKELK